MPKNVVSFNFIKGVNGYVADDGEVYSIGSRCNIPPDLDSTTVDAIATAIGATTISSSNACPDNLIGTPRRLVFTRQSGNSFTLPLQNRTQLLIDAAAVKAIVDTAAPTNTVVCIELIGEYFPNLNDIYGVLYGGTTFAPSHKAPVTANKQFYISGSISYSADAATTVGAGVNVKIKSITDVQGTPATQVAAEFVNCAGLFLNQISCPGTRRQIRKHRRFVLNFATKVDPNATVEIPQSESIEVPISAFSATQIKDCGTALAGLTGLFCMGYKGESYRAVHKLLP